jgi:hypothetical protein
MHIFYSSIFTVKVIHCSETYEIKLEKYMINTKFKCLTISSYRFLLMATATHDIYFHTTLCK